MTLLTQVMERPLDPGYAAAAERRTQAGRPPTTGLSTALLLVAAAVIGFLMVVAAQTLRGDGTSATSTRTALIGQVDARRAAGDAKAVTVVQLQAEVRAAQQRALGGSGQEARQLANQLATLGVAAGSDPANGPGIVVTLTDAPGAAAGDGAAPRSNAGFTAGRVAAVDLQVAVNGLWQAGAQAISINGERLTSLASIRFAGQAILVDYRPLAPPYEITALGDPNALQTGLAGSSAGSYLKGLTANYGIGMGVRAGQRLTVPGNAAALTSVPTTPTISTTPSRSSG